MSRVMSTNRRDFLRRTLGVTAGFGLFSMGCADSSKQGEGLMETSEPLFKISLAEWSLNPLIFGPVMEEIRATNDWDRFGQLLQTDPESVLGGEVDHLDFAGIARSLDIDAIEYVNTFFFGRAKDTDYLAEMKRRADDQGVKSLLIMCDQEGYLGHPMESERMRAVENHHKWVEAAVFLGCHSIRVNAQSEGSYEEQQKLAADGLLRLGEFADPFGINVIVENHGGLSSNGQWLAGVMQMVNHPRVGTLPDFGNFVLSPAESYDRYVGVEELMPYAKSVSAKATRFDEQGNEIDTDYSRMMRIVLDAGYRGYVGIEYEGEGLSPMDGIKATRDLLIRVREELTPQYA